MKTHLPAKVKLKCPFCVNDNYFGCISNLKAHCQTKHSGQTLNPVEVKEGTVLNDNSSGIACDICCKPFKKNVICNITCKVTTVKKIPTVKNAKYAAKTLLINPICENTFARSILELKNCQLIHQFRIQSLTKQISR